MRPARRRYAVGSAHRTDTHAGSWWDDWMACLKPRAGVPVPARPAFDEHPPRLCEALGTAVLEP